MANKTTKIGLIQMAMDSTLDNNLNAIQNGIMEAAAQGAKLILLPELHNSPYFCQYVDSKFFDLAESIPGPSTQFLGELAKQYQLVIVASLFERRTAGLYHNTAVVFESDGCIAGIYRKMHIPEDPGYYEKYYFTPGDLGFNPIKTSVGNLGVLICWDQWFPEAARIMCLKGADILLYPTAIGWDSADSNAEQQRQLNAWITIQRSHAVANGIPVVACNRTGFEPDPSANTRGIVFWGSSFIAGPQGELITTAPKNETTVVVDEINWSRTTSVRQTWPYLRDRRIDAYRDILKRYLD